MQFKPTQSKIVQKDKQPLTDSKSVDAILNSNTQKDLYTYPPVYYLSGHKMINSSIPSEQSFVRGINESKQNQFSNEGHVMTPFVKPKSQIARHHFSDKENQLNLENRFNLREKVSSDHKALSHAANLSVSAKLFIEQAVEQLGLQNKKPVGEQRQQIDKQNEEISMGDLSLSRRSFSEKSSVELDQKEYDLLFSPEKLTLSFEAKMAKLLQESVISKYNSPKSSCSAGEGLEVSSESESDEKSTDKFHSSQRESPRLKKNCKRKCSQRDSEDGLQLMNRLRKQLSSTEKAKRKLKSDQESEGSNLGKSLKESSNLSNSRYQKTEIQTFHPRNIPLIRSQSETVQHAGCLQTQSNSIQKNDTVLNSVSGSNGNFCEGKKSIELYKKFYTEEVQKSQWSRHEVKRLENRDEFREDPKKNELLDGEKKSFRKNLRSDAASNYARAGQASSGLSADLAFYRAMQGLEGLKQNINELQRVSKQTCRLIYSDSKIVMSQQSCPSDLVRELERQLRAISINPGQDQVQNDSPVSRPPLKPRVDQLNIRINGVCEKRY